MSDTAPSIGFAPPTDTAEDIRAEVCAQIFAQMKSKNPDDWAKYANRWADAFASMQRRIFDLEATIEAITEVDADADGFNIVDNDEDTDNANPGA